MAALRVIRSHNHYLVSTVPPALRRVKTLGIRILREYTEFKYTICSPGKIKAHWQNRANIRENVATSVTSRVYQKMRQGIHKTWRTTIPIVTEKIVKRRTALGNSRENQNRSRNTKKHATATENRTESGKTAHNKYQELQ